MRSESRTKHFWFAFPAVVALALIFSSCGSTGQLEGQTPASGPQSGANLIGQSNPSSQGEELNFLNEYLSQLTGEERREFLLSYLKGILASDSLKGSSSPPTGEENRVTDLSYSVGPTGELLFSFHYVNVGDYNQDGSVGIFDIFPLADHFFHKYNPTSQSWNDPDDEYIDGDGSGKVDIGDVFPIADHFFTTVSGYALFESLDGSAFNEVVRSSLSEITQPGEGRLLLAISLANPVDNAYYLVRPYQVGITELGIESNTVQYLPGAEGLILRLITPAEGGDGTEASPYVIVPSQPYELAVERLPGEDVSADAQITVNPDFLATVSEALPRTLTSAGPLTGDFFVIATLPAEPDLQSNALWFRIEGLPEL